MSNPADTSHQKLNQKAITVEKKRVPCDGGGGALGHPKVWLDMGTGDEVRCKYCDRLFRYSPNGAAPAH